MNAVDKTVPLARLSQDGHDTLPIGTRLHEFEVLRVLGVGGFGIVYLAIDHTLQRQVAVKEYMPSALVARSDGAIVSLRSASYAETFEVGLHSFINEARLLAQFDHPSLVKVYRFWEAHGTAYMAMQYYPGSTLKDERKAMNRAPDEAWLRGVIDPLLGALEVLHGADVYHRDISPDNILLLPDGRPVLLDFGAARRVIGGRTQTLTAILKPNYAPVEQYPDTGMRQGPWTDLYALAAVIRFMLTGQSPPPATARALRDEMRPLAAPGGSRVGNACGSFLSTIDWALAVRPQDRPHSVQVFRDALNGDFAPPRSSVWASFEAPVVAATVRPSRAHMGRAAARPPSRIEPPTATLDSRSGKWRSRITAGIATAALGMLALGIWAQNARVTHAASAPASKAVLHAAVPVAPMPTPPQAHGQTPAFAERANVVGTVDDNAKESTPQRRRMARPVQGQIEAGATGATPRVGAMQGSPRQICTDREAGTMPACMSRECRRPLFREHPQCLQLREAMARQAQSGH